jgi:hypothetical protein
MKKITLLFAMILIVAAIFPQSLVHADIAPPESPPGTNLLPGSETTQVRMMAETVTLTVSKNPSQSVKAIAKTEAVFTMRNLGTAEEKMQVRFPLSFLNGNSDGRGNFPEIPSIAVKIDGKTVSAKRENQPSIESQYAYTERDEIPWAVFDVTFPPGQDVTIEVVYTVNGFGYYPYEMFKYILQTGAGWNGTIGSADIIVRLPYEANNKNIFLTDSAGYGETTPGGVLSGNEIRWHFEEFEPTSENDVQILLVTPLLWENVLRETNTVTKNPNDGEAWGRLAKAYKEIARMSKGWLREDPTGREMFELSRNAYERCLALLPKDSLWQYGYADLLWSYYYADLYMAGKADTEGILPLILLKLQTALELDPNNKQAQELLLDISYAIPEAVRQDEDGFVFLGLTATPLPPTPYPIPSALSPQGETPFPTLTESPSSQQVVATPADSSQPTAKNPLCGGAFLLPIFFGVVFVLKKKPS